MSVPILPKAPDDLYEETERVLVWSEVEWDASVHAIRFPDGQEMIFFHLDCWLMTPSVLKSMLRAWRIFREANSMPLFTMATDEKDANTRLMIKFGFKYLREMPCTDGKTRNLYVHYAPTPTGGQKQE